MMPRIQEVFILGNITIRPVTEKDAPLLRNLASKCPPLDVHTPYTYWLLANFFGKYSFIISEDGAAFGYITCITCDNTLFIWQIGILEEYRKKNYSQMLIKAAFDEGIKMGIRTAAVSIAKENKASYKSFESFCKNNGYIIEPYKTIRISDMKNMFYSDEEILYTIRKLKAKRPEYTAETVGTVIKSNLQSTETPRLTVAFVVDGVKYKFSENVTIKTETWKIGNFPIGQRRVWQVKTCRIGDKLAVLYNPDNPNYAHIKGNDGRHC